MIPAGERPARKDVRAFGTRDRTFRFQEVECNPLPGGQQRLVEAVMVFDQLPHDMRPDTLLA
jgi:hypothetical protein